MVPRPEGALGGMDTDGGGEALPMFETEGRCIPPVAAGRESKNSPSEELLSDMELLPPPVASSRLRCCA